jgi:hypothetical protein
VPFLLLRCLFYIYRNLTQFKNLNEPTGSSASISLFISEEMKKDLRKIFGKVLTLFSEMSRVKLTLFKLDKEGCHLHTGLKIPRGAR